jgi:hypothetical protein
MGDEGIKTGAEANFEDIDFVKARSDMHKPCFNKNMP